MIGLHKLQHIIGRNNFNRLALQDGTGKGLKIARNLAISRGTEKNHIMTVSSSGHGRKSFFSLLIDQLNRRQDARCCVIEPEGMYFNNIAGEKDKLIPLCNCTQGPTGASTSHESMCITDSISPLKRELMFQYFERQGNIYIGYMKEPLDDVTGKSAKVIGYSADIKSCSGCFHRDTDITSLLSEVVETLIEWLSHDSPLTHIFIDNAAWVAPLVQPLLQVAKKQGVTVIFNVHSLTTFGETVHSIFDCVDTVIAFAQCEAETCKLLADRFQVREVEFYNLLTRERYIKTGSFPSIKFESDYFNLRPRDKQK